MTTDRAVIEMRRTGYLRQGRRDYATYIMDDGIELSRPHHIPGATYRLVPGPYCNVHTEMLRDKFKVCELEHANYFIYPKRNLMGGNDTHYAVSKPKIVGMILGWYIEVGNSP